MIVTLSPNITMVIANNMEDGYKRWTWHLGLSKCFSNNQKVIKLSFRIGADIATVNNTRNEGKMIKI